MKTVTFIELWQLLHLSETFDTRGRYESCLAKWCRWDENKRAQISQHIAAKLQKGEFVNPNPCFALDDAAQWYETAQAKSAAQNRPQTLSFNDYYAKYGTTEPRDGWKMTNPTGQQVIYVKAGCYPAK